MMEFDIEQLKTFYSVYSKTELIKATIDHIIKLQKELEQFKATERVYTNVRQG